MSDSGSLNKKKNNKKIKQNKRLMRHNTKLVNRI